MKSEKREKEERKSKNENTRLRRWGRENLTVLPYLRTYFRGLNAIRKSCFETPHTASCVTRTVLDRLCSDAGSSGTLRRKKLLFVVTRLYCCRCCLSKKRSPHTTCNPTWVLCHEHVNEMFGFLWITLAANSQKFVSFLTQSSHASQNEWKARRLCEKAPVFVLTRITFVFHRAGTLENFCTRLDSFLMEGWQCDVKVNRE